jgi:hypothetical protein
VLTSTSGKHCSFIRHTRFGLGNCPVRSPDLTSLVALLWGTRRTRSEDGNSRQGSCRSESWSPLYTWREVMTLSERQHILFGVIFRIVCRFKYPACNAQAPYCHVSCPTLHNFYTLSHRRHDFREKKVIEHKMCVLIFCTTSVRNIYHSRNTWARSDHKCVLFFILTVFNEPSVLMAVSKNTQISNFMKIRVVAAADLFDAGRQTWRT